MSMSVGEKHKRELEQLIKEMEQLKRENKRMREEVKQKGKHLLFPKKLCENTVTFIDGS